jgi:hypothetical protein
MKTSYSSLLALMSLLAVRSMAFSTAPVAVRTATPSTTTITLQAATDGADGGAVSRRDCWKAAATRTAAFVVAAAATATATTAVSLPVQSANAALSYDQVQDLLGTPDKTSAAFESGGASNGGRPTFLVEPTEEFKANEAKATIFKRQQLQAKQAFALVQEKITTDPNDETALAQDLDEMRRLVKKGGGLPAGILKDDVIRSVRRRKSKKPKFWPVNCEIAYQDLMDEIRKQQSPNTERDMDNPF